MEIVSSHKGKVANIRFGKMAKKEKEEEEEKVYANPVVFLRKSKAGNHLFVHDNRGDLIGGGTLIMNVSDVEKLIGGGGTEWIKVSVLPPESAAEGSVEAKEGE